MVLNNSTIASSNFQARSKSEVVASNFLFLPSFLLACWGAREKMGAAASILIIQKRNAIKNSFMNSYVSPVNGNYLCMLNLLWFSRVVGG